MMQKRSRDAGGALYDVEQRVRVPPSRHGHGTSGISGGARSLGAESLQTVVELIVQDRGRRRASPSSRRSARGEEMNAVVEQGVSHDPGQ